MYAIPAVLVGAAYLALVIYLVVLATRFVKAVEKFADKYESGTVREG